MLEAKLTERAQGRIAKWLDQSQIKGRTLRLTLVPSGCMGGRGYTYGLAPDDAVAPAAGEDGGVRVLVAPEDATRLEGTVVDFEEGLHGRLKVDNPHAVGKCPCGHHDLFG
jgi:iron-sulfur cluster assembly accessory protein